MQKAKANGAVAKVLVAGFAALTMTLTAGQAHSAELKSKPSIFGPMALYSLGALADGASTEMALRQNPNAVEGNPLLRGGTGVRVGAKAAEVAILTLVDRQIAKSHPKGAKVFRIVAFVSRLAIAAHNMKQAGK